MEFLNAIKKTEKSFIRELTKQNISLHKNRDSLGTACLASDAVYVCVSMYHGRKSSNTLSMIQFDEP